MLQELKSFSRDLENIENYFFEIAAYADELQTFGLPFVLNRIDVKDVQPVLDEFSSKLATCVRVAPIIDKAIDDRISDLLSESNVEDLVTQFSVRLKLAKRKRLRTIPRGIASFVYSFRSVWLKLGAPSLFSDNKIPLESVLASLSRLRLLVNLLAKEYLRKKAGDDEIFTPSNIDITLVSIQIELAIKNLNMSSEIGASEKDRLIAYLNEAKTELAEESPAWKNVVGALIICATLLSGVAAAPQAIDNLNIAIKHILGTSVEKNMPNLLPKLPAPDEKNKDAGTTDLLA